MTAVRATTLREPEWTGSERLSGHWLTRGRDGLLTACAPAEGAVLRWTQKGAGWVGPDRLPAPGLLPRLTVAQGADGYIHLVGMRPVGSGDGIELVHAVQFQTGRPLLGWDVFGHPNKVPRWTGNPAAVVDGEGRLYVALRNGGSGVSCRSQGARGGWGRWQDLGGSGVQESLAAAVDGAGLVEIFVPDQETIARYTQEKPGAPFALADRLDVHAAPGTLSALATVSGSVSLFFVDDDGVVQVWAPQRDPHPRPLMKAAGTGPLHLAPVMIEGYPCTVLAQETGEGAEVAFAAYPAENEEAGAWWTPTSTGAATGTDGPMPLAMREDSDGGLIAMALTGDGVPMATRQKTAAGGFALGRWKPLV
ncbi:hypothetical protein J7E88_01740 [Streptomyces sp. ISL-10]|uniref:hypothetical protein n=1 Tax=Streptomyces sp. ISL-10 TaxID=2819172 RepID=UPI001BE7060B|nr:hypothetical protein [Streptomyces sp. ISL-10]MBT2364086.1 hypothetical protein [Streptomyces sp. ISL-10]